MKIGIRPEAIKLNGDIPATVVLIENLGARFLIETRVDEKPLMVLSEYRPETDSVSLHIDTGDIHVFDENTGWSLRSSDTCHTGDF